MSNLWLAFTAEGGTAGDLVTIARCPMLRSAEYPTSPCPRHYDVSTPTAIDSIAAQAPLAIAVSVTATNQQHQFRRRGSRQCSGTIEMTAADVRSALRCRHSDRIDRIARCPLRVDQREFDHA